jgi:hypothetical protein
MNPKKILVCILGADLVENGSRTPQVKNIPDCGLGRAAGWGGYWAKQTFRVDQLEPL